jgi:uncharacterized membrane protein
MLSMREVSSDTEQVPGVALLVSYLLVLTSIVMLVVYVTHIGRSLRVSALIELVGHDTRRLLDRFYGERLELEQPDPAVISAADSGVVVAIDRRRLVELASAAGCVVHMTPALGQFVPAGAALARIEGDPGTLDRQAVTDAVTLGLERTLDEDVAYGFRMLVDMAERALSESPFLDPTTAVQAIDRLHDGLRQLAVREFPDGRYRDASGRLRLTVPVMSWEAYVHLVFDEVRLAGIESPQVTRRLVAALDDLLTIAPPERRPPLQRQLDLIVMASRDGAERAEHDQELATRPDPTGIGPHAGDASLRGA